MWKHPLAREVTFAVVVKLAIVVAAGVFIFGPGQRPVIDASSVQQRLIGVMQPSPESRSQSP
ncbi:MAG: hypothetical protein JO366_08815 [Methylobacteriaceae bacterium]|nr:hypothetical protein [Methylobacteriaceae bacterium]MBV9244900.1 hypothetical protein [Methylobacteriaceae bacterium]